MSSFIGFLLVWFSATLLYRKRFTSGFKIGGLYLVQLYYLIATPIAALFLFDIGSDIFSRPIVGGLPIPGNILFNAFNFFVMLAVVGMGIHSTSASVYQTFKNRDKLEKEAYKTNELFHGPWSHNMVYIGSLLSITLLGLLEINHPYFGRIINFNLLMLAGIMIGVLGVIGVLRAMPIRYDLMIVVSLLCAIILGYSIRNYALNINSYPMAVIALSGLVTLFTLLLLASLIFAISESISKRVINKALPKGHPLHEGINIKVLTMKIEQDFDQDREIRF